MLKNAFVVGLVLVGCGTEEQDYLKEKRACLVGHPGNAICIKDLDKESCSRLNGTHGNQSLLGCDLRNSGSCQVSDYELVFLGDVRKETKEYWCSLNGPLLVD